MNDLLENQNELSVEGMESAKASMMPDADRKELAETKPSGVTYEPPAPQISMGDMVASLAKMAENPAIDPEKMSRIMDLQERMMDKDAEMQFNKAMSDMQSEMPIITKDGSVEYEKDGKMQKAFDFASFENIMKAVKPVMSRFGFAIRFDTDERDQNGGGAIIHAVLSHSAGHSVSTKFAAALDSSGGKNNIQAMGSTYSYGKRYCVTALLNIITENEDDDGNAAFMEEPIDDEQFEEVQRLIDLNKTDAGKYCGHLGITSLKAMPKKMYLKACHDLEARAKKIAEKEAAAKAAEGGEAND